jgi:hypothetical protein
MDEQTKCAGNLRLRVGPAGIHEMITQASPNSYAELN